MGNYFDHIALTNERWVDVATVLKTPMLAAGANLLSEAPYQVALAPQDWHFGVLVPLSGVDVRRSGCEVIVARFRIRVKNGDVRAGCVNASLNSLLGNEIEISPQPGLQEIEVEIPAVAGFVVFRTGLAKDSVAPILEIHDTQIVVGAKSNAGDVVDVPTHELPAAGPCAGTASGMPAELNVYGLIISHSTRRFDLARASAESIRRRYTGRDRFLNAPDFDSLPSASTAHYLHGALTYVRLNVSEQETKLETLRCIDSRELIEHAAAVGGRLVICANGFVCALPSLSYRLSGKEFDEGSPLRIDDPWFAGLHSVVPIDADECLVSSAGPDAALFVDLPKRRVKRRFRLPASVYGTNYELTPEMSVHDHYIPNDYQLGHLNSAYPDEQGGCYVTTLGQGDIGHFDYNGNYKVIASGYVGLHGLRRSLDGTFLYFAESPTGKLWKIARDGTMEVIGEVEARWLHDALQVAQDVFACLPVDRNELVFLDVRRNAELARFDLRSRGSNPQFISAVYAS